MNELRYYTLGTTSELFFNEIHTDLTSGVCLSCNIECVNDIQHSPTRGEYLLTDEQAEILKQDDRIKFINLSLGAHNSETYAITGDDQLYWGNDNVNYNRYGREVKNWQIWHRGGGSAGKIAFDFPYTLNDLHPTSDAGRASSQLLRCSQKRNPWLALADTGVLSADQYALSADIVQKGAGENVDLIVADNGCWFGHTEFINPNRVTFGSSDAGLTFDGDALSPQDYVGGNVLPGEGYCDVLDLILDGPYYIDPDWFNASPSTRLTTRFDGTTVPVESVAREWWGDVTKRSSQFYGVGTVTIPSTYTRDAAHGSNSTLPTRASADHGTQCSSLAFGRTHGWAYNANKWHIPQISNGMFPGLGGLELSFDVQKIFHENKPINPTLGTRDPTISSNSWGFRSSKNGLYYYFQQAGSESRSAQGGVAYGGLSDEPEFLRLLGLGSAGYWSSEMFDNSLTEAGKEMVDSGVIFVVAAGNSMQTQVNPDDPNYDNHISLGLNDGVYSSTSYSVIGLPTTGTSSRRGFPQHIGKTESQTFSGNETVKFPGIMVGALDDEFTPDDEERMVNYSNRGNAIDIFAPADGTLAASVGNYGASFSANTTRVDDSYEGLSTLVGARDVRFSGTSAACPVAAGLIATIIQYNRDWTYENLRNWIKTSIELQDSGDFYQGTRATYAEDPNWVDFHNLQGADPRVIYAENVPSDEETRTPPDELGKIFTKPSDDIVDSNNDNMLIINSGTAYQVPFFDLKNNYDEIKFSMLTSWTNHTTDNLNDSFFHTFNSVVTGTSKENFSYIGFTYNDGVTGLPTTNGVNFIGIRFDMFLSSRTFSRSNIQINHNLISDSTIFQDMTAYKSPYNYGKNGKFAYYATTDTTTLCSYYPNAELLKDEPPKWKAFGSPSYWTLFRDYFLYTGIGIEVLNKGESNQRLRLKLYQGFSPDTDKQYANYPHYWTGVSMYGSVPGCPDKVDLPNVRFASITSDYLAESQDIPWNKDGVALDLPNNFFWYNSLPDLRPRISTLTGQIVTNKRNLLIQPKYALYSNKTSVNEGDDFTITLATEGISDSTLVYYTVLGIQEADITESLTDYFTVVNNTASKTFNVIDDLVNEENEIFKLQLDNGEAFKSVTINDSSDATYNLSSNVSTVNEGGNFTITLTTVGVADGTTVPYTITGIQEEDIAESLTGNFTINNNIATATFNVIFDYKRDSDVSNYSYFTETFTLTLDNGQASQSVTINDTSQENYILSSDVTSVNEGGSFTITLSTQGVDDSTPVPYLITGIEEADILEPTTGNFIINNNIATETFNVSADSLTEGTQIFNLSLSNYPASQSVIINDTSVEDSTISYSLSSNVTSVNEGNTFNMALSTIGVEDSTPVPYTITGVQSADISSPLSGNFIINNNFSTKTFYVSSDSLSENETFTLTLNNGQASKSIQINDTGVDLLQVLVLGNSYPFYARSGDNRYLVTYSQYLTSTTSLDYYIDKDVYDIIVFNNIDFSDNGTFHPNTTTFGKIKDFIDRGGVVFDYNENWGTNYYINNPAGTTYQSGTVPNMVTDLGGIKSGLQSSWKRISSLGILTSTPSQSALDLDIINPGNHSTLNSQLVDNASSNGIPIIEADSSDLYSIIHMWDGSIPGHLNNGINGKIIIQGDIFSSGDTAGTNYQNNIINPMLDYIARTRPYKLLVSFGGTGLYYISGRDRNGNIEDNNPALTFNVGDRVLFNNFDSYSAHPFYIKTVQGTGTGNQAAGVSGAGTEYIEWVPQSAGTYYYQCSIHNAMYGTITVTNNEFNPDFLIEVSYGGTGLYTLVGSDRNGSINSNNPALTFNVGDKVRFSNSAYSAHPLYIKTVQGTGTGDQASGVIGAGTQTVDWTIPSTGTYYYQCSIHNAMHGTITVTEVGNALTVASNQNLIYSSEGIPLIDSDGNLLSLSGINISELNNKLS